MDAHKHFFRYQYRFIQTGQFVYFWKCEMCGEALEVEFCQLYPDHKHEFDLLNEHYNAFNLLGTYGCFCGWKFQAVRPRTRAEARLRYLGMEDTCSTEGSSPRSGRPVRI